MALTRRGGDPAHAWRIALEQSMSSNTCASAAADPGAVAGSRVAERAPVAPKRLGAARGVRTIYLKQLHLWHWVSAAVSLVGMLLFAITASR